MSVDKDALLAAVLDTSGAAIFVLDTAGAIVFANNAAEQILGLRVSEVVGRRYDAPLWQAMAPDGGPWPDERQPFVQLMRTGAPVRDVRHAIEWPDGQRKQLSINGAPIKDAAGDIQRLVFSVTDITGLARAEKRAQENGDFLQLALEAASMGLWTWDVAADRVLWTDEVYEVFGVGRDRFDGSLQGYLSLIHPEDVERMGRTVRAVLEGSDDGYTVQHRVVAADGGVRWLECRGSVERDADGKPLRLYGCAMDITAQKQAEKDLIASQEQLRHAQRMESVGRLAGGIAHDFNNLLTAVIGFADLALAGLAPDSPEGELVAHIRRAANGGAALTRRLLAFARQQVVKPRGVAAGEQVAATRPLLQALVGEAVTLRLELEPGAWSVEIDPVQLEQVLLNVVVNARDAMRGGGVVEVAVGNVPGGVPTFPGDHVLIRVRDTGEGMSEATRRLACEPFFTTKDPERGTGLGLSTSLAIVKQAGGVMELESQLGVGTEVRVRLPRAVPEEPTVVLPVQPRARDVGDHAATILLVEDDDLVRRANRLHLERAGFRMLEAPDADRALQLFGSHGGAVDLLLTDIVMPGMNGAELAERLTTVAPDLKILFLSGYAEDVGRIGQLRERGADFLLKPYTSEDLVERIARLLGRGASASRL